MTVLLEHLEEGLQFIVTLLKFILEAIAVFCIFWGLLKTAQLAIFPKRHHQNSFTLVRLNFGNWLALALEFQLGADILGTTISPKLDSLITLGAITLIRTFLNYFLSQELKNEYHFQEKSKQELTSEQISSD